nr:hypothetical protein [uncultured Massilia sp.]
MLGYFLVCNYNSNPMPRFEVRGKGQATGRARKRTYDAVDGAEARRIAETDGMLVANVVELPPEPPTDAQLATAREHGIDLPAGMTKDELSDLISLRTWRDKLAAQDLREFAASYGAKLTAYSGKRLVFDRIFTCLSQQGREKDLAAWFAYRVYRELVGGSPVAPIKSPHDPVIATVASQLVEDTSVIQSIRRYRGEDLIWFGRWTAPDGNVHEGGSNRTVAYKRAAELLRPLASDSTMARKVNIPAQYAAESGPHLSRPAAKPSTRIEGWIEGAEQSLRQKNSNPIKMTRYHIVMWAVLALLLGLLIFGP